jgi:hypothetical protein
MLGSHQNLTGNLGTVGGIHRTCTHSEIMTIEGYITSLDVKNPCDD